MVGQWGYPKVTVGPLIPPNLTFNTEELDSPSSWLKEDMTTILQNRLTLLRGRMNLPVDAAAKPSSQLITLQELAMASSPIDSEMTLERPPSFKGVFGVREAPVGLSAPYTALKITANPRVPRNVEKTVADHDLTAQGSVIQLYDSGISDRHIVRLLSVGLLGTRRRRRIVPTEWSITATDDIVGEALKRRVIDLPLLDHYQVYVDTALHNTVAALLMPGEWMFEAMESWLAHPDAGPIGDWEVGLKRRGYPEKLAGAYHATRLAALEHLCRIGRQAACVVFLEVDRGWIPMGVWRFREIARRGFLFEPYTADSLNTAVHQVQNALRTPIGKWLNTSSLIKRHRYQKRIVEYIGNV
jgi:hypothetical protein